MRRTLIVGADPAVHSITSLATIIQIRCLDPFKRVSWQGLSFGFYINLVKLRGIQSKDLGLVFFSQLLVTKLLAHVVWHLETFEGIDTPLRRTPPQAVSTPHDTIGPVVLYILAQTVCGHHWIDYR